MTNYLFFRFDASSDIGLGHAFRCIALIEFIYNHTQQYPFRCLVVTKCLPDFIQKKLSSLNTQIYLLPKDSSFEEEALVIDELYKSYNVKALVLDGYQFNESYRYSLKKLNVPVVSFDDTNDAGNLHCDVVINALANAYDLNYEESAKGAKYLLGLEYSIVRAEFLQQDKVPYKQRQLLLVNFGGSDVGGLTLPTLKALAELQGVPSKLEDSLLEIIPENVVVITGGACEKIIAIKQYCQQMGYQHIHQCEYMAELLTQCKMAICAPGAIVYELAYCQVPSVFLTIADNQMLSAQAHQNSGWCLAFNGRSVNEKNNVLSLAVSTMMTLWQDQINLEKMSIKAQKLVDGKGVARIVSEIQQSFFIDKKSEQKSFNK